LRRQGEKVARFVRFLRDYFYYVMALVGNSLIVETLFGRVAEASRLGGQALKACLRV
jgi:hypothetical protein